MYCPKHFGQSGHPIPEPELRTTAPARMSIKSSTIVMRLYFWNLIFDANVFIDVKAKPVVSFKPKATGFKAKRNTLLLKSKTRC